MRGLFVILGFVFISSGCASSRVMDAKYSSKVDPGYSFSISQSIGVIPRRGEGANTLETKFYVAQIVEALRERGFLNVASYRSLADIDRPLDIVILANVGKQTDSYQYQAANYGMVDSGRSTVNCSGYGYSVSCTENQEKTVGVTGYSTKTGYLTGYYVSMNWFDYQSGDKILFALGSSYEEGCSDRAVYEFLVDQTSGRLDFEKPNDYEYSIVMPEDYSCNR